MRVEGGPGCDAAALTTPCLLKLLEIFLYSLHETRSPIARSVRMSRCRQTMPKKEVEKLAKG